MAAMSVMSIPFSFLHRTTLAPTTRAAAHAQPARTARVCCAMPSKATSNDGLSSFTELPPPPGDMGLPLLGETREGSGMRALTA